MACTFTIRYLAILIIVALFLSCALAEAQEAPFRWRFSEDDSLFACAFTRVKISGGQGPFYMMAVDIDSAATVHRLEERADDEWVWKINHLSGAKLLLSVIDATGASGGVAPELLTVQQGELACSSSITTISGLAVTVDVTDTSIGRCDSPVVNVLGGTPPYTFTILEQGAHAHNITADRAPDFAKHVAPHSSIFVVASDSKGRWSERPLRLTSPSTSCAEMPPSMQTILKRSSTQLATLPIILGAVIGFVIFLVLASATLGICWVVRRRRRRGMCTNALCFASQHSALPPQDISSAMISRGDEVRQYTVTKARNVIVDLAESPPSLTPLTLPQPDLDLDCSPPVNIVDGVLQPHLSTLSSTSVGESQAAHPYAAPGLSRASTSSLALSIASGDISSPLPFPSPAMPTPALIAPSQAPSSRLFPNEKRALRAAQHHRATSASCARKRTRHGSLPGPSGLRHSANEISGLPSSSSHQLDRQREMVCNWERRQPAMDKAFRPALYLSSSSSSPSRAPIPPIATNLSPVRPLPLPPLSAPAQTAIPPRRIHDQNGAQRAREPRLRHMHSAGDVHAIIRARQREALRQELEQQAHQHEVARHLSMMQRVPEHGLVAVGENPSPETISLSPPPPYSELMLARIMSAP